VHNELYFERQNTSNSEDHLARHYNNSPTIQAFFVKITGRNESLDIGLTNTLHPLNPKAIKPKRASTPIMKRVRFKDNRLNFTDYNQSYNSADIAFNNDSVKMNKPARVRSLPAAWTKIRTTNKHQVHSQQPILRLVPMQDDNSQICRIVSGALSYAGETIIEEPAGCHYASCIPS